MRHSYRMVQNSNPGVSSEAMKHISGLDSKVLINCKIISFKTTVKRSYNNKHEQITAGIFIREAEKFKYSHTHTFTQTNICQKKHTSTHVCTDVQLYTYLLQQGISYRQVFHHPHCR